MEATFRAKGMTLGGRSSVRRVVERVAQRHCQVNGEELPR